MLIDCDTCSVQGLHCHDCVITVLLNAPPQPGPQQYELDSTEQIALVSLAAAGLVPPLRLVPDHAADYASDYAPEHAREPVARRRRRDTRGIA